MSTDGFRPGWCTQCIPLGGRGEDEGEVIDSGGVGGRYSSVSVSCSLSSTGDNDGDWALLYSEMMSHELCSSDMEDLGDCNWSDSLYRGLSGDWSSGSISYE